MPEARLWAPHAFIDGHWQAAVLFTIDAVGCWSAVIPGVSTPPNDAAVLAGPVLPGLVNAHSHAFQRAFAGLAERSRPAGPHAADDFWSWRDRMYAVAQRVSPAQLRAIAAQLFVELLQGGYTEVCEFHYLHRAPDGQPYQSSEGGPHTLAFALADAAADVGIGLTVLPVLYERAGFTEAGLRDDQRRFASTPAFVWSLHEALLTARRPLLSAGLALHSLRAASLPSIEALLKLAGDDPGPIHIHVAEQLREVQDCQAATGARPIEWLCAKLRLDSRWQLVHATHATPAEIAAVAATGAGIVACPTTEANLGDGLLDLSGWLHAGVSIAIGSDSQVARSFAEELRWLEYGQRLVRHARNIAGAAAATANAPASTASRLFTTALTGGARASGRATADLRPGARADLVVLDLAAPGLAGVPPSHLLDALMFATDAPAVRDVYVGGRAVLVDRRHPRQAEIAAGFAEVMAALWHEGDHLQENG
jgi:formimidoylglutamate deiminase